MHQPYNNVIIPKLEKTFLANLNEKFVMIVTYI